MLDWLERLVGACFYSSGLVKLAEMWTRRSGPKLLILCHHRASGTRLRGQLLYLKRHYRIMHLEDALVELYGSSQSSPRDRRTLLVVAFDDGYQDNYTHAFALAQELHVPITIFLVPDIIQRGQPMSWLAGEYQHFVPYAQIDEVALEGRTYLLKNPADREHLSHLLNERARFPRSIAEREDFLQTARNALGLAPALTAAEMKDLPLTWSEVEEMERSTWVSFGAHTMHHPMLTSLVDEQEVAYEIYESRTMLEQTLGHPVRAFAYPYGAYGARELHAVSAAQYACAVTTVYGSNTPQTDPHQLHRIVVGEHQHWLVVAAKVAGVWEAFLRPCRKLASFGKRIPGILTRQKAVQ